MNILSQQKQEDNQMAELNDTEMEKEKESKENQIESLQTRINDLKAASQKDQKVVNELRT